MPNVLAGVGVIIQDKNGRVLLGLRKGSHGAGTWALPGGHIEFGESLEQAAIREVKEETGIQISECDVYKACPVANNIFQDEQKHYVTVFMIAKEWSFVIAKKWSGAVFAGQFMVDDWLPPVLEPNKCEKWGWFYPNKAPGPLFTPTLSVLLKDSL